MQIKKIIILLFFIFSVWGFSQEIELSPLSKISILTVGNANELHSKFGHTAIRIQDASRGMDIVFGYGGFDFNDPLFYYKFTTGKLDYSMTGHRYANFLAGYKIEKRWVREQQLKLTEKQRNTLFRFLQENYKEENRYYKYDFLFDNCATKIPEVFKEVFKNNIEFDFSHLKKTSTFRQLIHETLETNAWSTLGIDLALGSVIDKEATPYQHMFLPHYVYLQFANTKLNGSPIVVKDQLALDIKPHDDNSSFFTSPFFCLMVFLIIVLYITYRNYKNNTRSQWLDFTLLFASGLAGLLIVFLWFFTNHWETKLNFNAFWAVAPNIIVAFFLLKKQPPVWIKKYLWVLLALFPITLVLWLFKIQIFSPLIVFILLALAVRYVFLIRFFKTAEEKLAITSN